MIILHGFPDDKNRRECYDYDPYVIGINGEHVLRDSIDIGFFVFKKIDFKSDLSVQVDRQVVEHYKYKLIGGNPAHYELCD